MPSHKKNKREFSKLYDEYIDKIYRFVFVKVDSRETAEDITAEVFTRGWVSFNDNNKKIDNVSAFLYQIARNLVTDFYRQKGQVRLVSTEHCREMNDPSNLTENAMLNSDMARVKQALSELKSDYQDVIVWHYLNEFSVPEIANMTKKSESAVRVMLHRALKALNKELGDL